MRGCLPLTDAEIVATLQFLRRPRDRALFVLGICTGFRISELLSLTVADVRKYGRVASVVSVSRGQMKGKRQGRAVDLHPMAQTALEYHLAHLDADGKAAGTAPLFPGRGGAALSRQHATEVLGRAFTRAALGGRRGTHSMRKTFAARVYQATGSDLHMTQLALGHTSITSTVAYLQSCTETLRVTVRTLAFKVGLEMYGGQGHEDEQTEIDFTGYPARVPTNVVEMRSAGGSHVVDDGAGRGAVAD